MSGISFFDIASELHAAKGRRKVGRSMFEVNQKIQTLFSPSRSPPPEEHDRCVDEQKKSVTINVGSTKDQGAATAVPPAAAVEVPTSDALSLHRSRFLRSVSMRTPEEVLAHIESNNNDIAVQYSIHRSLADQFEVIPSLGLSRESDFVRRYRIAVSQSNPVPDAAEGLPVKLTLNVSSQMTTNTFCGHLLRHWLALRYDSGLSTVPSSTSVQHHVHPDYPASDSLSELFQDVSVAIASANGAPILPLRRLVVNKRGWPMNTPPISTSFDRKGSPNTVVANSSNEQKEFSNVLCETELHANSCLQEMAAESNYIFSHKTILSILQTKTFRDGKSCLFPPFHFTLFIPEPILHRRQMIQEEEMSRMNVESEAFLFFNTFAKTYFNYLGTDCEQRMKCIRGQALNRHHLHKQFFEGKRLAEIALLVRLETEARGDLQSMEATIATKSGLLPLEHERVQCMVGILMSRQRIEVMEEKCREALRIKAKESHSTSFGIERLLHLERQFRDTAAALLEEAHHEFGRCFHESMKQCQRLRML